MKESSEGINTIYVCIFNVDLFKIHAYIHVCTLYAMIDRADVYVYPRY